MEPTLAWACFIKNRRGESLETAPGPVSQKTVGASLLKQAPGRDVNRTRTILPTGRLEGHSLDEWRFDGRVIVVTGGGRGIGREHALLLGARGATVVVNDPGVELDGNGHSAQPAVAVAAEINEAGGRAVADTNDISTPEGGAALVQDALSKFGSVHGLVHNAGAGWSLDTVLGIHLKGAFHVLEPLWPIMREQQYGRVVLTSSSAGLFGYSVDPDTPVTSLAYGAAKMGLAGMMHNLANIGRHQNILVNAIAPVAYTRMTESMLDDTFQKWLREEYPPGLVSPLVAWLLHEKSETTHQIFGVGGGRVARIFVAETRGFNQRGRLTIEDVSKHLPTIMAADDFRIFDSAHDELDFYAEMLGVDWKVGT
jgi:NAD(P)-dependent dehydrogenase (short-subunit alcohol dehydrogenase family)